MAKVKIADLAKDVEISKDKMKRITGGNAHAGWMELLNVPDGRDCVQYRESDCGGRCDHADF